MLAPDERARYDRQIMLAEIGVEGQERLARATVLVAGAGGLGSAAATYLVAAGVGRVRIADHDVVEPSNLNRQVLHWQEDVGSLKAESAARKLSRLNPHVEVEPVTRTLDEASVREIAAGSDVVVDAMDSLATRMLLNRASLDLSIPLVHGAVRGFEGRIMTVLPRRTACLGCISRGPVEPEVFPVIGTSPAVIGSLEAMEALKCILGLAGLITDRLLLYDGLAGRFTEFRVRRNPACVHCAGG